MKKTIGILGGMGPLATADLLIKIVTMTKAACDNEHIRVFVDDNAAIPDRTAAILHGGRDPVPEMLSALRNLEKCGADCLLMPCNTAHYFLPRLQAETEIPFINVLAVTAERCAALHPGKPPRSSRPRARSPRGCIRRSSTRMAYPFSFRTRRSRPNSCT
ncbi:MAG: amino acid racemase [Oscillospiraceae bacterium]|nr:amino acid racemase [Oscillospiraceae bacterium]